MQHNAVWWEVKNPKLYKIPHCPPASPEVAGPVPPDVVPEDGRAWPGPGRDSQPGEDGQPARLDSGEVEHQGGQTTSSLVPASHGEELGVSVLT